MQLLERSLSRVVSTPSDVDKTLTSLGLDVNDLHEILRRGMGARQSVTENHPITFKGQMFYGESVSAAREILRPKGFERKSIRNVELTINDQIALYICRGCEQTGLANGKPSSALKKGDFTRELMGLVLDDNPGQLSFSFDSRQELLDFGVNTADELIIKQHNKLDLDLWILLYCLIDRDEFGNYTGIRAELSKPHSFNTNGIINSFSVRLILSLPTPDFDLFKSDDTATHFTPEIDIQIEGLG